MLELVKIRPSDDEDWVEAAVEANYGLVAFRNGDAELGRQHYMESIRKADLLQNKKTKAMALIHWVAEDSALDGTLTERLFQDAMEIGKRVCSPDVDFLLDRLRQRLDRRREVEWLTLLNTRNQMNGYEGDIRPNI
jgi:hypothetical protein